MMYDFKKGVDEYFAVEVGQAASREVAATVLAWAACSSALGRMYEEVGYTRTVDDKRNKVVYTRGVDVHHFDPVGDGVLSTLMEIEGSLRNLQPAAAG